MKFKIAKNIYTEPCDDKTFKKALRKIAVKRPVQGIYVITKPLFDAGIMEIYNYSELLQPFYRKKKDTLHIIGIARSREAAKRIVCDILEDAYSECGSPDIDLLFGTGEKA